jgi:hypothetical protein
LLKQVYDPSGKKKPKDHVTHVTEEDERAMAAVRITVDQESDLATPGDRADSTQLMDLPPALSPQGDGATSSAAVSVEDHEGHMGGDASHPTAEVRLNDRPHMGSDQRQGATSALETCDQEHVGHVREDSSPNKAEPRVRDAITDVPATSVSDPAALWQEAYDPGSDSYYYYREITQVNFLTDALLAPDSMTSPLEMSAAKFVRLV